MSKLFDIDTIFDLKNTTRKWLREHTSQTSVNSRGRLYTLTNQDVYELTLKTQREEELQMIEAFKTCPPDVDPKDVSKFLSGGTIDKVSSNMGSNFYNGSVMHATSCIASSVIQYKEGDTTNFYTARIRQFLADLKPMGEDSVSGYALSGSIKTTDEKGASVSSTNIFVVKAPRNPEYSEELIHECIVAFYCTNKMRDRGVPNFAYVHGAFLCSAPILNADPAGPKTMITFCNNMEHPVYYAIYENVQDSVTLTSYLKTANGQEIMDVMLQILLSLAAASDMEFSHQDLHTDNIMIRTVNKGNPVVIQYPMEEEGTRSYFTANGVIATIIDYGSSRVTIDGKGYGHVGETSPLYDYGIRRDVYNPIHDQFKLINAVLLTMRINRNADYQILKQLTSFFSAEDSDVYIDELSKINWLMPWSDQYKEYTSWDFINYFASQYESYGFVSPISDEKPEGIPFYNCGDTCGTVKENIEKLGVNLDIVGGGETNITTMFDFYNSIKTLDQMVKRGADSVDCARIRAETIASFKKNYKTAFRVEYIKIGELNKIFTNDGEKFEYIELPNVYNLLPNDTTFNGIKKKTTLISKHFSALQDLRTELLVLKTVHTEFKLDKKHDLYLIQLFIRELISTYKGVTNAMRDSVNKDLLILKTPSTQRDERDLARIKADIYEIRGYKKYKYYWTTYPTLAGLVKGK
jgi:serine/threonine protein kinase